MPRIKVLSYECFIYNKAFEKGTYIFSDIERLNPEQAKILSVIWEELASGQPGIRLLNHPTHSMRRFKLLRSLHEQGYNAYNIYRLGECRTPKRFPVFIRGENDHAGSITPLLETQGALDSAIDRLSQQGQGLKDKVMIEFCNTADSNGVFRKYSAYIVGDRAFPQHMMFGEGWMLKSVKSLAKKKAELYEERHYLRNNPHENQLKEISQLAGINYGRFDYGILDAKPQIWEINTNPTLMNIAPGPPKCSSERVQFVRQMISALEAIDCEEQGKIMTPAKTRISNRTNISTLKLLFSSIIAHALDMYYYLRQWMVPRTRRIVQHVLWRGKVRMKRLKGWGPSNARD